MKTLIAEDSGFYQKLLPRYLGEWGFDAVVTKNGAETWKALSARTPIELLMEMTFPLQVGTEVEVNLRVDAGIVLALGTVKTSDPQVGNGIEFIRMLAEDRQLLTEFLKSAEEHGQAESYAADPVAFTPGVITALDSAREAEIERFGEGRL